MKSPRTLTMALVLAALALGLPLLAAGCGGGGQTETVTETVGGDETTAEATDEEETTSTEQTSTEEVLEPGEGRQGPHYFTSPSENIGCYIDARAARCDIRERAWKPPPEPASCRKIGLDYGQGIVVDATHAEFICAGDTALGGPKTLGYGESAQRGPFLCDSEPDGITCSHVQNGHGFFLSRQSYRIF